MGLSKRLYESIFCENIYCEEFRFVQGKELTIEVGKEFASMLEKLRKELDEEEKLKLSKQNDKLRNDSK